jgi:hypothetical protein
VQDMDLTRIAWRKATYSSTNGGECVEVGTVPATVAVRDSKDPQGPALAFAPQVWAAFTSRVQGHMSKAAV